MLLFSQEAKEDIKNQNKQAYVNAIKNAFSYLITGKNVLYVKKEISDK